MLVRIIATPMARNNPRNNSHQNDMEYPYMKPIASFTSKFLAYSVATILLGSATLISVANAANDAAIRTEGPVSYVSGGVGTESLDQLSSIASQFNLKLVFALTSGDFLSDVHVVIADVKGKTLLDTMSEGPWFLSKLPVGTYRIAATVAGKEQRHQISVGATKLTTVDFRWASQ